MNKENKQSNSTEVQFQLRHRIAGRMPSVVAHSMIIQSMPELVVLSFFETILPPKTDLSKEDIEQLKETGLLAECVARITMPPQAFLEAADAMQRIAKTIRQNAEKEESKPHA